MTTTDDIPNEEIANEEIATSGLRRLYRGQTAIDFYGRRRVGLIIAIVVVVVTVLSLSTRGLNLGLDFEGGDAWDVPASEIFGVDEAEDVLADNGVSSSGARIQRRTSETTDVITIQVEEVPSAVALEVTEDFAAAAGVAVDDVSFSFTSSTWGSEISEKALRALVIFLIVAALFISIRFEWRMAVAALVAMAHDVIAAVGVYSLFQLEVTPATVIAFLTILGYSLYDTIVVFDRVQENEGKYAGVRMPYEDVVNISMNQVLMRSINTSVSSILPVISLLLIGAGFLGASTLKEFALALLIGMLFGVYSSIFVATPLLATLKANTGRKTRRERLTGEDLRAAVIGVGITEQAPTAGRSKPGKKSAKKSAKKSESDDAEAPVVQGTESLLSHPPRPRKKKRR
ncbi:MAG: protein translocase subunit SecF [Actinobacteria bacterium]|nr:MAG: protein translocase subunit SecF [Actinomycetota bacterium]